jgi:wyosine [tRNA(Phe)-imidazoG37] synthetase (radical SAM superfamily)
MLVAGVNDSPENIIKLADLVSKINPHKAYLAIPTRPPARISVHPPTPEKLNLAWQLFNERNINAEFLNGFEGTETGFTGNIYEDILNITAVHPLREEVLHSLLEKDNSDLHYVKEMVAQHLIRQVTYNGHKYYVRDYHVDY